MTPARYSLTARDVRRRLAGTRRPADPLAVDFPTTREWLPEAVATKLARNLRPAGVLIPLIERHEDLVVLLTERSPDLKHHAGQVSFPGGGMEHHDEDIVATALRETHEEVGIVPDRVDIAGYLAPTPTITGFAVTPVVGFVHPDADVEVDTSEVAAAFEVPLAFLLDPGNEEHSVREFEGHRFPVVTFHYAGHRIWGATAGMIVMLRKLLLK